VLAVRDIARTTIEKKLKSEAKLGRWDEQTYYSLAESAEKSHRKLSKLLHDYDIALDVSAATVLHKCMTRGIGERADGEQLPTVEVPSPLLTFAAVSSIDTVKDLQSVNVVGANDDDVTAVTDGTASAAVVKRKAKPSRKSKEATVLDSIAVIETEWLDAIDSIKQSLKQRHHEYQDITATPEWLTSAITGISDTTTTANGSLTARLPALSRRMSRLIGKALYSSSASKTTQQSDASSASIAIQSSPVGIQGALASEDICSAVFSRIHALRATDAGKQVKRRAVIDLLRGLKRQGLSAARADVPYETRDALCVLSLPTPYTLKSLATASGTTNTTWLRADTYHYKAIAEVARLRLESEAPASKDITRREGGIMSNYADHLHCLVLQQRAMVSASSADVCDLTHIINKLASLASNSTTANNNSTASNDTVKDSRLLELADERVLQSSSQVQTRGIVSGIEAIEQMLLLTKAVSDSIPTTHTLSSGDTVADVKIRQQADNGLKTAKATLKSCLEQYQQQQDSSIALLHSDQLLETIQKNIEQVTSVSNALKGLAAACTTWVPAQSMATVVHVLDASVDSVQNELQALNDKRNTSSQATEVTSTDSVAIQAIASQHIDQVREALEAATESLLLSVQSLVTTPQTAASANGSNSDSGNDDNDDTQIEDDSLPLVTIHTAAFEQARALKTWRCTTALQTVHTVLEQFSSAVAQYDSSVVNSEYMTAATVAITAATSDVLELAYQVQAATNAVLTSLIALNKGTAKLSYVLIRVFRTLLCKGICSDKTEDTDDTGDDNGTGGLQFSDDVEGTGMGEGDGKKDVSDQIEDEEQLLGLQSDKQQESKEDKNELDDDNKDDGIEMANDFEGDMHDVPKEDQKDDDNNSENDEQELDREMGDAGDTADVIDEKLWDDDDDDNDDNNDENGTDKEQEKFEQGSRMDGEKLEDEIRTKDDTEETSKDDSKKQDDDESKQQDEDTIKPSTDDNDDKDDQADGDDNTDGNNDEQEGPINEDLEDNYEDKPLGIDVKGQEDEGNGNDSDNNDNDDDDIPDNLELDGNDDGIDDIEDDTANDNNEIDDEQEGQDDDQSPENDDTTADKDDIDDSNSQDAEETADTTNGGGTSASNDNFKDDDQMDVDEPSDNEQDADDTVPIDDQQQQQQPDDAPAHGIEAKTGDSAILEKQQIDQDGAGDDQDDVVDDDSNDDSKQQRQQPQDESGAQGDTGDNGEGGEWRHDSTNTNETSNGITDKSRRREAPNPLRSPGNAMEHWHERLDMLKRQENDDDQDDATQGNAYHIYLW
jgi:midasin